jgi:N6-L-threonylcarbamoyladenine synthase
MTIILAIETSCDETAVAIVNNNQVLSSVVSSQIDLHRPYGGVVPEMASRQHLETINFCLEKAWQETGLTWSEIDGIAVTVAPGLVGALMVGMTAAKTLAIVHDKPFIGIHHLEGHIYASYLAESDLKPPFLSLLVSGGHTSLIHVQACGKYQQLGTTRDDAAGEAFDKVARLLNLSYPGGPIIDRIAKDGNPQAFPLPEGKISLPTGGFHAYDSSFSGLKTAVLRLVEKFEPDNLPVADIAASFQDTVARSLTRRTINCALDYGLKTIAIGGGVAANSALRNLCTDNAAMIARAAVDHYDLGHFSDLSIGVRSRLPLSEVMQLYNTSDF